ncbi:S9 family peptidase [Candidatus Cyanaurora vandensis]|uniref:alpha/beta hydrolase family protein n=1 Tax=Candidatus Cyanaurora vandensis TaxID=2714958 RepID=UPI002580E8DB|nr:S9 family peptidase [Candidatus Cyanaurora vandensis]
MKRALALMVVLLMQPLLAQTLTPAENLVTEGIPALPVSLAEGVNRYTEFRAAGFLGWHPVKRELLLSTRFGDTAQVHQVKFPGGDRRQLTFFPDRIQAAAYPPRAAEFFVFDKDTGGNEFTQFYRYDLKDGAITLLTDGTSRNSSATWSPKTNRILYTSTRRNRKDTDLYLMDPRDPKSDKLLAQVEGGGWSPLDWSPDESLVIVGEYVSINESYLWLYETATGDRTLLTPKGAIEKVAYGNVVFAKDGKGIYTTSDQGSEFNQLRYISLAGQAPVVLSGNIPWDVESFDLTEDGKTLAFVTNEDGVSVLHLLDTATRKPLPAPKLPVGIISGIEWHNNSQDLGMSIVSARATADVYSWNRTTGKVDRWTESETGGLNPASFVEPKLVRWPSFDNRTISGFLYRPPARFTGKRPVIINIHGGPEAQYRPGFLGRNNYLINELGAAMVFPNVRGSAGYGKTFLKLDNGFLREDSVKDIGSLLDWLKTQPDLDPERVMVTGGSYGGYMTLAVATNYAPRIRCALDVVGISNFVTFLEKTEDYRRDLRRVEYGDERDPAMREFLLKISPTTNARQVTKPLFVVQGKNDPRVPLNEAEQMVATVKQNGSPVWYLMAKDEGHGFAKKKNADFQFYATVAFIQQYLL